MSQVLVTGMSEPLEVFGSLDGIKLLERDGDTIRCDVDDIVYSTRLARIWSLTLEEITADGILVRAGPSVHCFCGLKLHYIFPHVQRDMESICRELGEFAIVTVTRGYFYVQRHFIALHGIDYDHLHERGFERVERSVIQQVIISKPWMTREAKRARRDSGGRHTTEYHERRARMERRNKPSA